MTQDKLPYTVTLANRQDQILREYFEARSNAFRQTRIQHNATTAARLAILGTTVECRHRTFSHTSTAIVAAENRAALIAVQEQILRQVPNANRDTWWRRQWARLQSDERIYNIQYLSLLDLHFRAFVRFLGTNLAIQIAIEEEI